MTDDPGEAVDFPPEARQAVERTIWEWGVQGDSCALLANNVLAALEGAGFVVVSRPEA